MKNSKSDRQRVFLVGSARSGTTLLQSILASHPEITSFPETHFFRGTIPKISFLRWINIYGENERNFIKDYLHRIDRTDLNHLVPSSTLFTKKWIKGIIDLIDALPTNLESTIWVEKTPMHLYFVSLIYEVSSDTKFIHIIRDGKDVVASLFEASRNNPESFDGSQSIKKCIFRWKIDIQIHKKHLGKENHFFIFYKDIINKTDNALKQLCKFLGIDYSDQMKSFSKKTRELKFEDETWKPDQSDEIRESHKFDRIFLDEEKAQIRSQVNSVDLDIFRNSF